MSLNVWFQLGLLMAMVLTLSLYALAVSGQFPIEHRAPLFNSARGMVLLFGSMIVAALCLVTALAFTWRFIPWYGAIIGGGLVLLMAPLVLHSFSDTFVNGRAPVFVFGGASLALAVVMLTHF